MSDDDNTLFGVSEEQGDYPDEKRQVFLPPVARNTDPETSKQAAATVNRQAQMGVLLNAYRIHGPLTDHEAGHLSGLGDEAGHKRGSDLRNAGLIEPLLHDGIPVTRRGPSGRACRVCVITAAGTEVSA